MCNGLLQQVKERVILSPSSMRNSAYDNQIKSIMRKKLLFLTVVFLATLSVWAESPQEAYKKHPKAMCMFFSTPKFKGDLEGFDIERIAIYPVTQKVAIKTTQRAKDVVKNIKDMWRDEESEDNIQYIMFTDGSGFLINMDKFYVIYLSTKKESASFMFDKYRQKMYEEIIGTYNTEEK